jgi:undecaprenyl-diphosphatase
MIDFLFRLDAGLLLRINACHAPWLDEIMWALSSKLINLPLAVVIFWILKRQFSWQKASILFLMALTVVAFADVISTQLFKDVFQRLRPSHHPVISSYLHFYKIGPNNPYVGGRYGFVSSHAANLAAMFAFILPYLKPYRLVLYLLAIYVFLVSYSRVYLGVHYPSDVFCGALLGALIAWLFRRNIFATFIERWH